MPRGNATGPMGMGPRTDRGAGFCTGSGRPGYLNNSPAPGYGLGPGFGRGCGRRNHRWGAFSPGWSGFGWAAGPYNQADPGLERQILENRAQALQSDLEIIRKRLNDLETGSAE